jgi:hypothetical protein
MTWKPKHPGRLLAGAIGGVLCAQFAAAQDLDDLFELGEQRILQAQAQQQEIDAIVEVTADRFEEYQVLLREVEDLQVFNNILQAQVDAQTRELNQLYRAIDDVGLIERQILPLMTRMITGLERFVQLDVPFLLDERMARVERLRQLLRRSDVVVASQFSNVLEAWLIEMEDYGTTGDVYTDEIITADGARREVQLLRIGRIALLYLTPDGLQAGAWDQRSRQWVAVDDLAAEIRIGIDAYLTEQPAMFVAPVAPPEER